ncbi:hypothetical protein C5N14_30910 [Micromonospora sp. MW-13]|nr:hypothetical protein C5N14_30910 [Micromonospora sp. MW-13]
MAQVYAYARQAGFDPAAAVIMAAIAAGESGLNPGAVGDVSLQDATWGPSVGLTQIRTLKADTGTGRTRDITRLRDPLANLTAAYEISGGGRDWTPWTVYTSGKYRQYLGQAQAAAGSSSTTYIPGAGAVQRVGLADDMVSRAGGLVVQGLIVVLGVVLVVAGAARTTGGGR